MSNKIYGIDLGTTNSLIGCGDELYGGLVPSIANISKQQAGEKLRHTFGMDVSRSFKINMSCGEEGREPRLASALVLKEVISQVPDKVENVVISVPAYFTDNERQATRDAAESIGLTVRAIINEPTAAAIYYSRNKKGLFVIFDLGGGTFDVSVIDGRYGIFDVQATDGLVLGGDNFDEALSRYVLKTCLVPHRFHIEDKPILKAMCEQAKITIQKTKKNFEFDLTTFSYCTDKKSFTLTVKMYKEIEQEIFKKTIRLTKQIINRAIAVGDPFDIILVGGSTRCPFLREWIEDSLDHKCCPLTYDPDKIVAQGAAFYAELVASGEAETKVSDVTKALGIGMSDGTVRNIIPQGSKIPISESLMVTNPEESDGLSLMVYQGDSVLAQKQNCIGEMNYEFADKAEANSTSVKVTIDVSIDGIVHITAKELLKPERSIALNRDVVSAHSTD